jgi:hypothetical protein
VKALSLISVREFGRRSSINPEHPEKALLPIAVSEFGRCSSTNPEHPEKAVMPIAVNLSGMNPFFFAFHLCANARSGTVSHPKKESAKSKIGVVIVDVLIQPSRYEDVSVGADVLLVSGTHSYSRARQEKKVTATRLQSVARISFGART